MKRLTVVALLCILMLSMLMIGWAWAQETPPEGETQEEGQTEEAAQVEEEAEEAEEIEEILHPNVMWGDYRYTFSTVFPSSDIDPQSVIMNWFTPEIYNANWAAANYMQLYITIDWLTNDRSLDYMPLQLVLVCNGRRYIMFGKACANASYIWRRGNHYQHDLGCRYPDHVGDDARLFFTFDTNGAAIDPNTAYIEVKGMLEVWDWGLASQTYTYHENYYGTDQDLRWSRKGSSYFTYTHIMDIPLRDILPPLE